MTDKEQLELAAKAAGFKIVFAPWCCRLVDAADQPKAFTVKWNPLEDDGDALRLAVKIALPDPRIFQLYLGNEEAQMSIGDDNFIEVHESDPYAATRLAIVRAAAEIGKGMK